MPSAVDPPSKMKSGPSNSRPPDSVANLPIPGIYPNDDHPPNGASGPIDNDMVNNDNISNHRASVPCLPPFLHENLDQQDTPSEKCHSDHNASVVVAVTNDNSSNHHASVSNLPPLIGPNSEEPEGVDPLDDRLTNGYNPSPLNAALKPRLSHLSPQNW